MLEVRLIRALPGRRAEDLLVQRLTQAIESNVRLDAAGGRIAPNVYTLTVHRSARPRWQEPALLGLRGIEPLELGDAPAR
ncbi:MAG: hypothetical protein HGB17_15855 [Syntrophobacteraceae bacterium]|nr:hypothetical protein [Syntrophobacteraceae bacterium]